MNNTIIFKYSKLDQRYIKVSTANTIFGISSNSATSASFLKFDTSYTPTGLEPIGSMYWNSTDGTFDTRLSANVTMQNGQELPIKVYNDTGAQIDDGTPVYIAGRQGHVPKIAKAQSNSMTTGQVLGLVTSDIPDKQYGYVTTFGYVRQIKTNYTGTGDWGTTWAENDKLYVSKTVAGQLTNVEPTAPHHSDVVGIVAVVGAVGTGAIQVNIINHKMLEQLSDVDGSAPDATGDLLTWNQTNSVWERNAYNITDYLTTSSASSLYIKKSPTAIEDNLITIGTATYKGLVIKNHASQSANPFEVQNSSGTVLAFVSAKGYPSFDGGEDTDMIIGKEAYSVHPLTSGSANTAIGYRTLYSAVTTTTIGNVAIGYRSMYSAGATGKSPQSNVFIGYDSALLLENGSNNVGIGKSALYNTTSGSSNVAIGQNAGYLNSTGSNCIFIGRQAGYRQTTTSNLLIIDNVGTARANATEEQTNSIVYGVIASVPTSQTLRLNAVTSNYGQLNIVGNADATQAIIKANATQTTNLTEWQNSSGTVQALFDSSYNLIVGNTATAYGAKGYFYRTLVPPEANTYATLASYMIYVPNTAVNAANGYGSYYRVDVQHNQATTNCTVSGFRGDVTFTNVSGGRTAEVYGVYGRVAGNNTITHTCTNIAGGRFYIDVEDVTTTNARGLYVDIPNVDAGSITTGAGLYLVSPTKGAGTYTTAHGIYIEDVSVAGTNNAILTNAGNIVFNEGGDASTDFRVESDTEANMLYLDANGDTDGALYLGGTTNGLKITKGGKLQAQGTATWFDDVRVEPTVRGSGSKAPVYTQWTPSGGSASGIYCYLFDNAIAANEKEVNFKIQMPHGKASATAIHLHVHWMPTSTGSAGDKVRWGLEYTKANPNAVFSAPGAFTYATDPVNPPSTTPTQDTHYITEFADIDMTGDALSTILLCRLFRNSSNAADTFGGDVMLLYIDCHVEFNQLGSNDEYSN